MGAGTASRPGSRGYEQVFEFGDFGGATSAEPPSRPATSARADPPDRHRSRATATATAEVTLAEVARGAERMVDVDGRRLQVKIPAGVSDGAKIKLRGGGAGRRWRVRRPRHHRPRQARSALRAEGRRPHHRAPADAGRGAARRRGAGPHPDRQGQAPHPAEHPERAGDPRPPAAGCRSAAVPRPRRAT